MMERRNRIAVIGMAGRFPGARDVTEFWQNIRQGVDSIRPLTDDDLRVAGVPAELWQDPRYLKVAAYLDDIEMFDARFFGVNPREAAIMDPQNRLFLEEAWHAMEDAGQDSDRFEGPIAVFAGSSTNAYLLGNVWTGNKLANETVDLSGIHKDFLTTNVSYRLNLRGPSVTVQSFCSTSLVAIHMACQSLLNFECDMALAGGVRIAVPQRAGYLYEDGAYMSSMGKCRAFDAGGDGIIFGSGVGVVVLKRLEDALSAGDRIRAVVCGSCMNNDGGVKVNYMAPSVDGQATAVLEAMANADVDAEDVGYIEAHGTGTPIGDPIEVAALAKAYRSFTNRRRYVALGSVKPNIGHLDAAAGVASFIKLVLALQHREIPPLVHFERPNPALELDNTPFYVTPTRQDWVSPAGKPRVGGVTALGFGGTNVHMLVEEAPAVEASEPARRTEILVVSAKSKAGLDRVLQGLAEYATRHPNENLSDVAMTLQLGRRPLARRAAIVASSLADIPKAVERVSAVAPVPGLEVTTVAELENAGGAEVRRSAVFLFPGLGAQYCGMGAELFAHVAPFRTWLLEARPALDAVLGTSFEDLLFGAQTERARLEVLRPSVAQPLVLAFEWALAKTLEHYGVEAQTYLGHSLGDYVAATLAGVFSLPDALRLVNRRGVLIEKTEAGATMTVQLSEAALTARLPKDLSLSGINAPTLCTVGGRRDSVLRFQAELQLEDIACRVLHVPTAAHSFLFDPILSQFAEAVRNVEPRAPTRRLISSMTGGWLSERDARDPDYWAAHLRQPTRFAAALDIALENGPTTLFEVGPGRVLTTFALAKSQFSESHLAVQVVPAVDANPADAERAFFRAIALGWCGKTDISWEKHRAGERRSKVNLPGYPFEKDRFWIEPTIEDQRSIAAREMTKNSDIDEWFYVHSWQRLAEIWNTGVDPGEGKTWLVFSGQHAAGRNFVELLRERGEQAVHTVTPGAAFGRETAMGWTLRPHCADDYRMLLSEFASTPGLVIVHFWALDGGVPERLDEFTGSVILGCQSLIALAQAWRVAELQRLPATPARLVVVTERAFSVTAEEGVLQEGATAAPLSLVVNQECERLFAQTIDLLGQDPLREVAQLLQEVYAHSKECVVALRQGHRWGRRAIRTRLSRNATVIRRGGVYAITGGLGSVGSTLAACLASEGAGGLVLLSRTGLPDRDVWDRWMSATEQDRELLAERYLAESGHTRRYASSEPAGRRITRAIELVRQLEAAGVRVLTPRADVGDAAALRSAFAVAREELGALDGVVHAAGYVDAGLDDTLLEAISSEQVERQIAGKVSGVYAIAAALEDNPIDFVMVTSSNAALLGGLGASAYAAVNAFIEAYCSHQSRRSGRRWFSAAWDGWPSRRADRIRMHIDRFTMTSEEAFEASLRVLSAGVAGLDHVIVSSADLEQRLRDSYYHLDVAKVAVHGAMDAGGAGPQPDPGNEGRTVTEQRLVALWQEAFGTKGIGLHDNFFDLGGHSLMAAAIIGRVRRELGLTVSLGAFIQTPTIAALAAVVDDAASREEGII